MKRIHRETQPYFDEIDAIKKTIDFSSISCTCGVDGTKSKIKTKKGCSVLHGLLKKHGVSVADGCAEKGTVYPEHIHMEFEFILLYKGCMWFTINGIKKKVKPKEFVSIPKNIPHSAEFIENSCFIVITVPESDSFPKGA
jgi:quercetin dioxygenase-like cupin family protein